MFVPQALNEGVPGVPTPQFGPWLAALRSKRELSLRALARAAGCSLGYVATLEKSEHPTGRAPRVSREIVRRLAQALEADVDVALMIAGYAPELRLDHYLAGIEQYQQERKQVIDAGFAVLLASPEAVRLHLRGIDPQTVPLELRLSLVRAYEEITGRELVPAEMSNPLYPTPPSVPPPPPTAPIEEASGRSPRLQVIR